jgi:hypothetical protein
MTTEAPSMIQISLRSVELSQRQPSAPLLSDHVDKLSPSAQLPVFTKLLVSLLKYDSASLRLSNWMTSGFSVGPLRTESQLTAATTLPVSSLGALTQSSRSLEFSELTRLCSLLLSADEPDADGEPEPDAEPEPEADGEPEPEAALEPPAGPEFETLLQLEDEQEPG